MRSGKTMLLVTGLLAATLDCAVYNESCPITTPEVWGKGLAVDLDIREEYVRQCEAPVGNFMADALRAYPYGLEDAGVPFDVEIGLFNAGAIRDEVVCGEAGSRRERIPQGPITDQDIFQLLPFYFDSVVVVKLTGRQLKRVLERSVSSLTLPGEQGEEGHFLHVSGFQGIRIEIDCNGQSQTLTGDGKSIENPGSRITQMCLGPNDPCSPILDATPYYVATLDFLVGTDDNGVPNDGFVGFHTFVGDPDPEPEIFHTFLPVIDVVREWVVGYEAGVLSEYPEEGQAILDAGYPAVEGRLYYDVCDLDGVCGQTAE